LIGIVHFRETGCKPRKINLKTASSLGKAARFL